MRPPLRRLVPHLYALSLAAMLGLQFVSPASNPWGM
jgi:hypothetical protein